MRPNIIPYKLKQAKVNTREVKSLTTYYGVITENQKKST